MCLGNGITMSYVCNLCASREFRQRYSINGRALVACARCDLSSVHPLPTHDELAAIYGPEYFQHNYFSVDDEAEQTNHFRHFQKALSMAREVCGRDGRVLEIGPGRGTF